MKKANMKVRSICLLGLAAIATASPGRERIRSPVARVTKPLLAEEILGRAAATTTPPTTTAPNAAVNTDVCGWVGGDIASPWICLAPGTCLVDPAVKAIGCCLNNYCDVPRTACIPRTATCNDNCQSNNANLICSDTKSPLCATYSYPNSVSEVRCVSEVPDATDLTIAYTYDGFTAPIALPRYLQGISGTTAPGSFKQLSIGTQTPSPSSSSSSKSGSSSSTISSSSSTSASSSSGSATASASASSQPESSNKGAIAGGVIGGMAVLAGIVGVALFFLRKRSQKRSQIGANGQVQNENMGWQHIPFKNKGYAPVVEGQASELQGFPKTRRNTEPTELEGDMNPFNTPPNPLINPKTRQPTLRMEMEG